MLYMLYENGVEAAMSFSQLVVTTRNNTIDYYCAGAGLGGEYIPELFNNLELQ
jgi:hypothetical protein